MSKIIKIDFYEIECPDGVDFTVVLQRAQKRKKDKRTLDLLGKNVRLQEIEKAQANWLGEIIRIRMDEMPSKISLDGDIEAIEFDDDEGLGEETAFLYHTKLRVLVLQRNHTGVTSSAFCRYFEEIAGFDEPIMLNPILEPEAYQRFVDLGDIRKVEIGIAGLKNKKLLNVTGKAAKEVVQLMDEISAPSIQISASMGRVKGGLNFAAVRSMINAFLSASQGRGPVTKIRVQGLDDGHETQLIDLIEDRMFETAEVELDEDRRLPYEDRSDAVLEAWTARKSDIQKILKSSGA